MNIHRKAITVAIVFMLAVVTKSAAAPGDTTAQTKIADGTGGLAIDALADNDELGTSVAVIGDLDGDAIPDLASGPYLDDTGGDRRGAVRIFFLNADGTVKGTTKIADGTGGLPADTLTDNDRFGISIAPLGDLDGDGVLDIAVGAYFDNTGGSNRGAVYILFLNANGTVKALNKIADGMGGLAAATLADNDNFGGSIASLGDVDGDTLTDIAVGATGDDTGGNARGAVHILNLTAAGAVKANAKIADGMGGLASGVLQDSDQIGVSVASIDDLDGDGNRELAVGTRDDDTGGPNRGAVYILLLDAAESVKSAVKIADGTGGFPSAVLDDTDRFGRSVSSPGDLDGDTIPDLAVCATGDDTGGSGRGAVYLLFLNAGGTVKSLNKIADGIGGLPADTLVNADGFGSSVVSLGDVNGDKISDLAVGAIGDDTGGGARGAVYVLFLDGVAPKDTTPPQLTFRSPGKGKRIGRVSVHKGQATDPDSGVVSVRYRAPGSGTRNALYNPATGKWKAIVRLNPRKIGNRGSITVKVFAINGDGLRSSVKRRFKLK